MQSAHSGNFDNMIIVLIAGRMLYCYVYLFLCYDFTLDGKRPFAPLCNIEGPQKGLGSCRVVGC